MTIYAQDSFNRPNSASLEVADSGQRWTIASGLFSIYNNTARIASQSAHRAIIDDGQSDGWVRVNVLDIAQGGAGPIFRYTDNNNYWYIQNGGNQIQLYKRVAGSETTVATPFQTWVSGDQLGIKLSGSTMQITYNGANLGNVVTDSFNVSATKHGLLSQFSLGTSASWDNFAHDNSNVATHLTVQTQPSNVSTNNIAHIIQPVIALKDSIEGVDSFATTAVTASLLTISGVGTPIGTLIKNAVNGLVTFTNLGVSSSLGGQFKWAFSGSGVTSTTSSIFTISGQATHMLIATQSSNLPAGTGAYYPLVPLTIYAADGNDTMDVSYGNGQSLFATASVNRVGGGTGSLTGPVRVQWARGKVTLYGVAVIETGSYQWVIQSPGFATVSSSTFTVSAPIDTFYPSINGGAALPRSVPDTSLPSQSANIFTVGPTGSNYTTIQAAIDAYGAGTIVPGDTIVIRDSFSFTASVIIPAVPAVTGSGGVPKWLVIRRETDPCAVNVRCKPSDFAGRGSWMPELSAYGIGFANGANHVRIQGMKFEAQNGDSNTMIDCGYQVWYVHTGGIPSHIVLDRLYMVGTLNNSYNTRRAVLLNGAWNSCINSYLDYFHDYNTDSQCLLSFNTPGPLKMDNNYLHAASENFLTGGNDVSGPDHIPYDITFTHNLVEKKTSTMGQTGWSNWIKNLFELKMGRRVLVEGNVFQGFWDSGIAQPLAFNIKGVNQSADPNQDYTATSDVTIRNNVIRSVAAVFGINGAATPPCSETCRVVIINNMCLDVNSPTFDTGNNNGKFFALSTSWNITFDHNTAVWSTARTGSWGYFYLPSTKTTISNTLVVADDLGAVTIGGSDITPTVNGILATGDPSGSIINNYIYGIDPDWVNYNNSNSNPTTVFFSNTTPITYFNAYSSRSVAETGDPTMLLSAFTIKTSSGIYTSGSDGLPVGVYSTALIQDRIAGVMTGNPTVGATQLAIISQPSSAQPSVTFSVQPVIYATDFSNTLVTTYTGSVTVSIVSGSGALTGTLVRTPVGGITTFTNLAIVGSGFHTLGFSAPGLTPVTGAAFNVSAAITPPEFIGGIKVFETVTQNEITTDRRRIYFSLIDSSGFVTGSTVNTSGVKAKLSKNGGTPANSTNDIVAVDTTNLPGRYYLPLTISEIDTLGHVIGTISVSGSMPVHIQITVLPFDPVTQPVTATAVANAILDRDNAVETGLTLRQFFRLMAAVLFGRTTGMDTLSPSFNSALTNLKPRVSGIVDENGNRSSVTTDGT